MSWRTLALWSVRHRAIVCGRAFDAAGNPFTDAERLTLCRIAEDSAPRVSKKKSKTAAPVPEVPETPFSTPYVCNTRPDGHFYFLDVVAGRYSLVRTDVDGKVVQTRDVLVPSFDPEAKTPIVNDIEFQIVEPAIQH